LCCKEQLHHHESRKNDEILIRIALILAESGQFSQNQADSGRINLIQINIKAIPI